MAIGLAFGVVAGRHHLQPGRLALLAGLLATNQYAAGALNDAIDVERDVDAGRAADKPIPSGAISRRAVTVLALASGLASLGFALALGPATLGLAAVGLACAWSYDLWLKGTAASVLPFAIALPLVPLFGYGAAGRFPPVLWWAWPASCWRPPSAWPRWPRAAAPTSATAGSPIACCWPAWSPSPSAGPPPSGPEAPEPPVLTQAVRGVTLLRLPQGYARRARRTAQHGGRAWCSLPLMARPDAAGRPPTRFLPRTTTRSGACRRSMKPAGSSGSASRCSRRACRGGPSSPSARGFAMPSTTSSPSWWPPSPARTWPGSCATPASSATAPRCWPPSTTPRSCWRLPTSTARSPTGSPASPRAWTSSSASTARPSSSPVRRWSRPSSRASAASRCRTSPGAGGSACSQRTEAGEGHRPRDRHARLTASVRHVQEVIALVVVLELQHGLAQRLERLRGLAGVGEVDTRVAGSLTDGQGDHAVALELAQQLAEGPEAVVRLGEGRVLAQHRALQGGGQHRLGAALLQPRQGLGERPLDVLEVAAAVAARVGRRLLLPLGRRPRRPRPAAVGGLGRPLRGLAHARKPVVEQELVAGRRQQRGGGALDADADHPPVQAAQRRHQRREVGVAGADHEGRHEAALVGQLHGVDRQLDVGGVLAHRAGALRDVDQLAVVLDQRASIVGEQRPVRVRAAGDHAAALGERFHDRPDVEGPADLARTEHEVLVVDEQCDAFLVGRHAQTLRPPPRRWRRAGQLGQRRSGRRCWGISPSWVVRDTIPDYAGVRDRSGLRRAAGGPVTGGAGDRAGRARGAQPRGRPRLLAAARQRRGGRARRRVRGGGPSDRRHRGGGPRPGAGAGRRAQRRARATWRHRRHPRRRGRPGGTAPGAAGGRSRRAGRALRRRGARRGGARPRCPPGDRGAAPGHLGAPGRPARRQRAGAHPRHLLAGREPARDRRQPADRAAPGRAARPEAAAGQRGRPGGVVAQRGARARRRRLGRSGPLRGGRARLRAGRDPVRPGAARLEGGGAGARCLRARRQAGGAAGAGQRPERGAVGARAFLGVDRQEHRRQGAAGGERVRRVPAGAGPAGGPRRAGALDRTAPRAAAGPRPGACRRGPGHLVGRSLVARRLLDTRAVVAAGGRGAAGPPGQPPALRRRAHRWPVGRADGGRAPQRPPRRRRDPRRASRRRPDRLKG